MCEPSEKRAADKHSAKSSSHLNRTTPPSIPPHPLIGLMYSEIGSAVFPLNLNCGQIPPLSPNGCQVQLEA